MRMLALVVMAGWSMSPDLIGASAPHVPFRLRGVADIVVPVSMGGAGPFHFLLDTGSSRSAISARTMSKLGLQEVAQTLMVTPGGSGKRGLVRIDRIAFGPAMVPTLDMMVLPAEGLGRGIDGLIGQDVLGALRYTIDYASRRVVWHADEASSGAGRRLQLEWDAGRFVVVLPQQSGPCTVLRVVPDSGTDGFVIFATPGRPIPSMRLLDVGMLGTLSGERLARTVILEDLHVGDVHLREQPALLIDAPSGASSFGDGLLPLHLFSRVTFNGPERYLIVDRARDP